MESGFPTLIQVIMDDPMLETVKYHGKISVCTNMQTAKIYALGQCNMRSMSQCITAAKAATKSTAKAANEGPA